LRSGSPDKRRNVSIQGPPVKKCSRKQQKCTETGCTPKRRNHAGVLFHKGKAVHTTRKGRGAGPPQKGRRSKNEGRGRTTCVWKGKDVVYIKKTRE